MTLWLDHYAQVEVIFVGGSAPREFHLMGIVVILGVAALIPAVEDGVGIKGIVGVKVILEGTVLRHFIQA